MKKTIVLFTGCILLLAITSGYGQNPSPRQKIKAMQVAVFTEVLNLTPAEAEKFWPIYNQYQEQLNALNQKQKEFFQNKIKSSDNLSEKDYKEAIDKKLEIEEKKVELTRQLYNDLQGVLPYEKIFKIDRAERLFKQQLLEEIKKRQGNRPIRR